MDTIFWISLLNIIYAYAGYPLILSVIYRCSSKTAIKKPITPPVSVVIAVFNEEKYVRARIGNILAQDYPVDKLEVVVVSDASTDGTNEIVRSFHDSRVRLEIMSVRRGKAAAINRGLALAGGEIVVFADARQSFAPDATKQLAANFADPAVGCVSGGLVLVDDGMSTIQKEMGLYWRYEKWIRKMESYTGSVIGATGAIYAIRKDLYSPLPEGILLDDVLTPLNVLKKTPCAF